ncbi:MAG: 2'-5' RNA ligase family protein [Chloroflexota bacterium]
MTESRFPPADASPPGRRVLVAVVTGSVGDQIQAWRKQHDPEQARRLPPHTTLCYWAPELSAELDAQVRHAFHTPIRVQLGGVREFDNRDRTFFIEVLDTADLDAARDRLYDATYLTLEGNRPWTWHVTCIRYGARRDLASVRELVGSLTVNAPWNVDRVALLELRGNVYVTLQEWRLDG